MPRVSRRRRRGAREGGVSSPPPLATAATRGSTAPRAFSRQSYWSPLVTTRSPASLARTSRQATMRRQGPADSLPAPSRGRVLPPPAAAAATARGGGSAVDEARKAPSSASPTAPDFSGWNWTAATLPLATPCGGGAVGVVPSVPPPDGWLSARRRAGGWVWCAAWWEACGGRRVVCGAARRTETNRSPYSVSQSTHGATASERGTRKEWTK